MNKSLKMQGAHRRSRVLFLAAAGAGITLPALTADALVINLSYDVTAMDSPYYAQVQTAMNYAAAQFENAFSNPITLNINVASYGDGLGNSISNIDPQSYATVRNALISDAQSNVELQAVSTLPVTNPTGGGSFDVTWAEEKALGLRPANDPSSDGRFVFGPSNTYTFDPSNRGVPGEYDFIGVAEHEIAEIMGRAILAGPSVFAPYDLFRYHAPGARSLTPPQSASENNYFSIDSGATNLRTFNSEAGSDFGDWQDNVNDSYDAIGNPSVENPLLPVDHTVMDILGYNPEPLTLNWNGGAADFLLGSNWGSTTQAGINPHSNASLFLNSAGSVAYHAFSSGENYLLGSSADDGRSLDISNGTFQIGVSGAVNGNGFGMLVDQDASLELDTNGVLYVAGPLSIGDDSGDTNAQAGFIGNSVINIGTVLGTTRVFYVGRHGFGTVNQAGNAVVNTPELHLGDTSTGNGFYFLGNSAQLNVSGSEFIGVSGVGSFTQNSGVNTAGGFFVGDNPGSTGTYTLTNGSLIATANEDVGYGGVGTFVQSGGSNTIQATNSLVVGFNANSIGAYTLSGTGSLTVNGNEIAGHLGNGTITQTAGANVVNIFYLLLGDLAGSTGTFNLSGTGTLSAPGIFVGGNNTGSGGRGILSVSGGVVTVAQSGTLTVYNTPGSAINFSGGTINAGQVVLSGQNSLLLNWTAGTLNLTNSNATVEIDNAPSATLGASLALGNGEALSVAGQEIIGAAGTGTFLQTGGTNTISTNFVVGGLSGGTGVYTMNGGTLTAPSENIGYAGKGNLNQTGGANTAGFVYVGNGGMGGISLSGNGTLNVSFDEHIGYYNTQGNFVQSGAANQAIGGTLYVGEMNGATGNYSLSGTGALTVGGNEEIGVAANGNFNQTSGTNATPILYLGYNAGSAGAYTLSSTGSLTAASGEVVGESGQGFFTQLGGANNDGSFLAIGDGGGAFGAYSLSGTGSLSVSGTTYVGNVGVGSFSQMGGSFTSGPITVNTPSIFAQTVGTATVSSFANAGTVNVGGTVTVNGHYTQSAGLSLVTGILNVTGGTTINGGTLQIGNGGTAGSVSGNIVNNGLLLAERFHPGVPLILANITGTGTLAVGSGAKPSNLALASSSGADTQGMVTVSSGSTLDLANNKVVINYGSAANDPVTAIAANLAAGYNAGNWAGTGIISSTAAVNPSKFAVGYLDGNRAADVTAHTVASNQMILKYTLAGDAFLENTVGFDDLVVVAQNFGFTGRDWAGGNFNYDPTGSVGFADLVSVAQNFGFSSGVSEGTSGGSLSPAWQVANGQLSSVPEPGAAASLLIGGGAMLRRRRMKRSAIRLGRINAVKAE